jgi:hypothetical protein
MGRQVSDVETRPGASVRSPVIRLDMRVVNVWVLYGISKLMHHSISCLSLISVEPLASGLTELLLSLLLKMGLVGAMLGQGGWLLCLISCLLTHQLFIITK